MDNGHTQRGSQQPSKGLEPHKRNVTTFSSTNQPTPKTKGAARKVNDNKKTQAQKAMADAGYNPMQQLIGIAQKYERMIINSTNWRGGKASDKEIDSYVKELTKINENLAKYFSSTAPVETSMAQSTIEDSVTADAPIEISDDDPLTPRELAESKRTMMNRLEEKF